MSQRASGYERKERDLYETPAWVTMALVDQLPWKPTFIWEPASGSGKMAEAMRCFREAVAREIAALESNRIIGG